MTDDVENIKAALSYILPDDGNCEISKRHLSESVLENDITDQQSHSNDSPSSSDVGAMTTLGEFTVLNLVHDN